MESRARIFQEVDAIFTEFSKIESSSKKNFLRVYANSLSLLRFELQN